MSAKKSQGRKPVTGIISFSQVASQDAIARPGRSIDDNNTPSNASEAVSHGTKSLTSPLYAGSDEILAVACKKLMKKDTTTRLKGFIEIEAIFHDRGKDVLGDFLPYFAFIFPKLALDNSAKARQQLVKILSQLLAIDSKQFNDYMKILIGPWWQLCMDPIVDVSQEAKQAFDRAIPKKKRNQVIMYLSHSILTHIKTSISYTPETLSDMSQTTQEDAEERFERVMVSATKSISFLLENLSVEENIELLSKSIPSEKWNEDLGYGVVLSNKLWKKIKSKNPQIRRCLYQLLSQLSRQLPNYFTIISSQDISSLSIASYYDNIKAMLQEENEFLIADMLDGVTSFLSICFSLSKENSSRSNAISLNDVILPKFIHWFESKSKGLRQQAINYLPDIIACYPSPFRQSIEPHQRPAAEMLLSVISTEYHRIIDNCDNDVNNVVDTMISLVQCSAVILLRQQPIASDSEGDVDPIVSQHLEILSDILFQSFIISSKLSVSSSEYKTSNGLLWKPTRLNSEPFAQNLWKSTHATLNQLDRGSKRNVLIPSSAWDRYLWSPLSHKMSQYIETMILGDKSLNQIPSQLSDHSPILVPLQQYEDTRNNAIEPQFDEESVVLKNVYQQSQEIASLMNSFGLSLSILSSSDQQSNHLASDSGYVMVLSSLLCSIARIMRQVKSFNQCFLFLGYSTQQTIQIDDSETIRLAVLQVPTLQVLITVILADIWLQIVQSVTSSAYNLNDSHQAAELHFSPWIVDVYRYLLYLDLRKRQNPKDRIYSLLLDYLKIGLKGYFNRLYDIISSDPRQSSSEKDFYSQCVHIIKRSVLDHLIDYCYEGMYFLAWNLLLQTNISSFFLNDHSLSEPFSSQAGLLIGEKARSSEFVSQIDQMLQDIVKSLSSRKSTDSMASASVSYINSLLFNQSQATTRPSHGELSLRSIQSSTIESLVQFSINISSLHYHHQIDMKAILVKLLTLTPIDEIRPYESNMAIWVIANYLSQWMALSHNNPNESRSFKMYLQSMTSDECSVLKSMLMRCFFSSAIAFDPSMTRFRSVVMDWKSTCDHIVQSMDQTIIQAFQEKIIELLRISPHESDGMSQFSAMEWTRYVSQLLSFIKSTSCATSDHNSNIDQDTTLMNSSKAFDMDSYDLLKRLGFADEMWLYLDGNLANISDHGIHRQYLYFLEAFAGLCDALTSHSMAVLRSNRSIDVRRYLTIFTVFHRIILSSNTMANGEGKALQSLASNILQYLWNDIGKLSDKDRCHLLNELLSESIFISCFNDKGQDHDKDNSMVSFSDAIRSPEGQAFVSLLTCCCHDQSSPNLNHSINGPISFNVYEADHNPMALMSPMASTTLQIGQSIWYIQQTSNQAQDNRKGRVLFNMNYPEEYRYQLLPGNLVSVHRESGAIPYYTISIANEKGETKEIQTEWYRLLLNEPQATQNKAMEGMNEMLISQSIDDPSSILRQYFHQTIKDLMNEAIKLAQEESKSLAKTLIDSIDSKLHRFVLLSQISPHLFISSRYIDIDVDLSKRLIALILNLFKASPTSHQRSSGLSIFMMGLKLFLSSLRMIQSLASQSTASYIINDLNQDVLWLPYCIHLICHPNSPLQLLLERSNSASLLSSISTIDYMQLLHIYHEICSLLFDLIDSEPLRSYHGDILSHSMLLFDHFIDLPLTKNQSTPSNRLTAIESKIFSSMLSCVHKQWSYRHVIVGVTANQPWESTSAALCLHLLIFPSIIPQNMDLDHELIDQMAMRCLYWCLQCHSKHQIYDLVHEYFDSHDEVLQQVVALIASINNNPSDRIDCKKDRSDHNEGLMRKKLLLCQFLDIYFSQSDLLRIFQNQSKDILETIPSASAATSDVSEDLLQQNELQESQAEERMLRSVCGNVLIDSFLRQIQQLQVRLRTDFISSNAWNEKAADSIDGSHENAMESDEKEINEDNSSTNAISDPSSPSFEYEMFNLYLLWLLILQAIDAASTHQSSIHMNIRAQCGGFIRRLNLSNMLLPLFIQMIPSIQSKITSQYQDLSILFYKLTIPSQRSIEMDLQSFAAICLYRTIHILPAMIRNYWLDEKSRINKEKISKFVINYVRSSLVAREMKLIQDASRNNVWTDELIVRGSTLTGEVIASYLHDEAKIEIKITLPSEYPLKNVEVEGLTRMGVDENRWRRWILQIVRLLSLLDGTLVDAVLLWKNNLKSEFEGIEPCPICYNTLHPKTLLLPSLICPTCKNKFHSTCLATWFKSSGKNKCVLCQQPFYNKHGPM